MRKESKEFEKESKSTQTLIERETKHDCTPHKTTKVESRANVKREREKSWMSDRDTRL